jgi:hypothetical protein
MVLFSHLFSAELWRTVARGVSICRIIVPSSNVPAGPLVLYGSIPKTTFLFEEKDIARRYRRGRVGLLAL